MDKKIIVNLYGKDIVVIIKDSVRLANTVHYSYGQIYVSAPINITYTRLYDYLMKRFKQRIINKFDNDFLYIDNYCYVLGEKRRLIRPNMYIEPKLGDLIIKNDDELKAKLISLAKDIISSRVKEYERIMNLKPHEVKITSMSSARGKNYYLKNLLTFHWELIHFSLPLIDSVVIHELSHDYYHNHSKDFYGVVYKYCPNYDEMIYKLTYGEKK